MLIAAAAVLAFGESASAGSCPADKVLKQPQVIREAPDVGVSRETLLTIDMTGWREIKNFTLRTRRLVVAPYGTVPTHDHADRPAIVYIASGEIWEYNTLCSVPIFHKAGEATGEFGATFSHWWENRTNTPVVLISSDVEKMDKPGGPEMMMD